MNSNNLYPMKFAPIYKSKIWGGNRIKRLLGRANTPDNCGESWELSGVEGCESVVANGFLAGNTISELIEVYMGDLVGERVYDNFGLVFPLLIKVIDAQDNLSVQVHPNDELAAGRHNSFGKTEMWYVLDSEPGSKLISGFSRDITRQEYQQALDGGRIMDIMNNVDVSNGDVFFIPAGTVHAIGKGCFVAEIQQTSDVTYRIYDYDRRDKDGNTRELHTGLALDAIDYTCNPDNIIKCHPEPDTTATAVSCQYFTTNVFRLSQPVEKDFPEIDSFIIYMCVSGACDIECEGCGKVRLSLGDTVLIPACISSLCFVPEGDTTLLEVYISGE